MHPQLVVAAYYGISKVPTLLAGGAEAAVDQLRTENEIKLQHKRMKNSELNELKLKSRERLNWFWAHNIIKCLCKILCMSVFFLVGPKYVCYKRHGYFMLHSIA
jgi:hypothetical protein